MVLDDVSQRADLFVKGAPVLDSDRLGHRYLYMRDNVAVPDPLEKSVAESEYGDILNGLFAEVVVDAEDLGLVKHLVQRLQQLLRRRQVRAEGFLDDEGRSGCELTRAEG